VFTLGVGFAAEMTKGKDTQPARAAARPQKAEKAVDQWLQRGLHDLFDEVAREPIPAELLRLIEEDKKK
jgi:hypothetical protein